MRSLKATGRLTRGRGMSEGQRTVWLASCAEMNNAMQEFSHMNYVNSEQHQDIAVTRRHKDSQDIKQVMICIQSRSPFDEKDTSLRNIETGVIAERHSIWERRSFTA